MWDRESESSQLPDLPKAESGSRSLKAYRDVDLLKQTLSPLHET